MPAPIKRRVEALQELQGKHDELEAEFRKERLELEAKYDKLYGEHPKRNSNRCQLLIKGNILLACGVLPL